MDALEFNEDEIIRVAVDETRKKLDLERLRKMSLPDAMHEINKIVYNDNYWAYWGGPDLCGIDIKKPVDYYKEWNKKLIDSYQALYKNLITELFRGQKLSKDEARNILTWCVNDRINTDGFNKPADYDPGKTYVCNKV